MTEDRKYADKFALRMPEGMRDRIAAVADANNRSMNAEIVSRLEFTFAVDVTVQDTGWDVGHGTDSPEMKAALLKQRLAKPVEPDALEARISQLESRVRKLENKS